MSPTAFVIFNLSFLFALCIGDCPEEQLVSGYKVEEGQCVEDQGCNTRFPFSSLSECQESIRKRMLNDACSSNPCHHGGICMQTNTGNGFECLCAQTGYSGATCEQDCASSDPGEPGYPTDCIDI